MLTRDPADADQIVGLEDVGACADVHRLHEEFGITPGAVAAAARISVRDAIGGAPRRRPGSDVRPHHRLHR